MSRRLGLLALTASLAAAIYSTSARAEWLDRSHTVFLPPAMSEKLGATQTFPLFWWNFLVVEGAADAPEKIAPICAALKSASDSPLAKISCGDSDVGAFLPLIRDWARDYPLRHPFPGRSELKRKFDATYATASLPMGGGLLKVFRADPYSSFAELRGILESQVKMDFPNRGGIFVDAATKRVVIPVQFKTPPSETAATARFYALIAGACPGEGCPATTLIGPHASTYANERQVQADVERVSLIGILLTAAQIVFLLLSRRARALWLFPPVLASTAVAALVTIGIFGRIHGLTLAFGTGLIGLAIDYGLHSAFNVSYRGVWRANLCGILTTVAGFAVMLASEIPLLRQLMVFAIAGLVTAYALFFFLHYRYGSFFAIRPFDYEPRVGRFRVFIVLAILAATIPAAFRLRPNLDMSQFDFQGAREIEVRNWLYPHLGVKASLLDFASGRELREGLEIAHAKQAWADEKGIAYQSVARFIPAEPDAARNRATWETAFCPSDALSRGPRDATTRDPLAALSPEERRFFSPALEALDCDAIRGLGRDVPAYVRDFTAGGTASSALVSVWLPRDDAETATVKSRYPDALSLREVVDLFPRTLSAELRWMSPLSILLATLLLLNYYRRISLTLLALVPFFCATGVYALGVFALGLHFSFISLIALLMIFGFSIDYGVFAVDVTLEPEGRSVTGVWTCLLFAAVATGLGFVPMLVCRHPVLAHLGETLTLGTIGTAIGTLWGVPGIARLAKMRMAR